MRIYFLDRDTAVRKLTTLANAPEELDYYCVYQQIEQKRYFSTISQLWILLWVAIAIAGLAMTSWAKDPYLGVAIVLFALLFLLFAFVGNRKLRKEKVQEIYTFWYGIAGTKLYFIQQHEGNAQTQQRDIQQFTKIEAKPTFILIEDGNSQLPLYAPPSELHLLWELLKKIRNNNHSTI